MVAATKEAQRRFGQQEQQSTRSCPNVGDIERLCSVVGGGALALLGLSRRSLPGLGLALVGAALVKRGVSGRCELYQAIGIDTAEKHGSATSVEAGSGVKIEKTFTVNRPQHELYHFWRDLENLPRFMRHLESVRRIDERRSHWVATGPLGLRFEWDAEIINDRPGELIAWRSLEGSQVNTAGSVHFAPARDADGTEVCVTLKYDPPAGKIGDTVARWLGQSPEQQIAEDLRHFERLLQGSAV